MKRFNFQIITKDFDLKEEEKYLESLIDIAVVASADILQLRNKKISPGDIYRSALFIKKKLDGLKKNKKPLLIINDRPDIACMVGADGFHLGREDFPAAAANKLFPNLVIGVSVDNVIQAIQAEKDGADYLGVGPVYATVSKTDAGDIIRTEALREMCSAVKIPVVAIGGINAANIQEIGLSGCGISGAAVINAVSNAEKPFETAMSIRTNIDKYLRRSAYN